MKAASGRVSPSDCLVPELLSPDTADVLATSQARRRKHLLAIPGSGNARTIQLPAVS
jgi:hypothetical protein